MNDTAFKISDTMRTRLAGMHARDGSLTRIPFELEHASGRLVGGGGLYGTALEYLAFIQAILNKGRGNRRQLLKPETVELMGRITSAISA
jgi:methyl acetate hydrolase